MADIGYVPFEGEGRGSYYQGGPGDSEDRLAAFALSGIVGHDAAALLPAISTHKITIAAGEAIVGGKRFRGPASVDLSAEVVDTWYIVIDPTNEAHPFQAKQIIGVGDMPICAADWSGVGSHILNNLVDMRPFGLIPAQLECQKVGAVTADQIGFFTIPVGRGFWLDKVGCWAVDNGSAVGPTLIDVHAGPASAGLPATTIFTTQASRPSMAHGLADGTLTYNSGAPESWRLMTPESLIIVEVDAATTNLADLSVILFGRWC